MCKIQGGGGGGGESRDNSKMVEFRGKMKSETIQSDNYLAKSWREQHKCTFQLPVDDDDIRFALSESA